MADLENFTWNNFQDGWIPSDSPVNGRKTGLIKMDNVVLDKNGALVLHGGVDRNVGFGPYSDKVVDLYHTKHGTGSYLYAATNDGAVYRNAVSIGGTGGGSDNSRCAFSTAFDYTLISFGDVSPFRVKDNGTDSWNLGFLLPSESEQDLSLSAFGFYQSDSVIAVSGGTINNIDGTVVQLASGNNSSILFDTPESGTRHFKWSVNLGGTSVDMSVLKPYIANTGALDSAGPTRSIKSSDGMYMPCLFAADKADVPTYTVKIIFGLGSTSNTPDDYFMYQATYNNGDVPPFVTLDQFSRVGSNGTLGWADVQSCIFDVVLGGSTFTGDIWGLYFQATFNPPPVYTTYEFATQLIRQETTNQFKGQLADAQAFPSYNVPLNVLSTGDGDLVPLNAGGFHYFSIDSKFYDPQSNEVWLFRRGGGLDTWSRVSTISITVDYGTSNPYTIADYLDDDDALTVDITYDTDLLSVVNDNITQILTIIGPIQGRWWYFTPEFMYPSEINNPDLFDSSLGVRIAANDNEIFLWAEKVAEGVVLVGTNHDIYVLSGTFATLADLTVDVYYRPLSNKYPPITRNCSYSDGYIYYLAADGWRIVSPSGESVNIVVPNLDLLYQNQSCNGYDFSALNIVAGSVSYPCIASMGRFYAQWGTIIHVYDSRRKYWHPVKYNIGTATAFCRGVDGRTYAAFSLNSVYSSCAIATTYDGGYLIDNTTKQTVTLLSPVFDGERPYNRKELYTIKLRGLLSTGDTLSLSIIDDTNTETVIDDSVSLTDELGYVLVDVPGVYTTATKSFQFKITATCSQFILSDLNIIYQPYPDQTTSQTIQNNNFGTGSKKRVRTWPFVIDCLGNTVTFTPSVDGVNLTAQAQTFNNNGKKTQLVFYKTDTFGIDYGMRITGGPFEIWDILPPDIVHILPIARQFDQLGPEELFRYGKVKSIELRALAYGDELPVTFYFNDNSNAQFNINLLNGREATYLINVPKGNAAGVVRVELGPVDFNFHRYYIRLLCSKTGMESDLEWVVLPPPVVS